MFCGKCGTQIPDQAAFCPACGSPVSQHSGQFEGDHASVRSNGPYQKLFQGLKIFRWVLILGVIIAVIVWSQQKHPAKDLKDVVFDNYGDISLGEAVDTTLENVQWRTEKIDSTHYRVTLSGFHADTYTNLDVIFDVNYSNDYIYTSVTRVIWNDSSYDDNLTITYVMSLLYGVDL